MDGIYTEMTPYQKNTYDNIVDSAISYKISLPVFFSALSNSVNNFI